MTQYRRILWWVHCNPKKSYLTTVSLILIGFFVVPVEVPVVVPNVKESGWISAVIHDDPIKNIRELVDMLPSDDKSPFYLFLSWVFGFTISAVLPFALAVFFTMIIDKIFFPDLKLLLHVFRGKDAELSPFATVHLAEKLLPRLRSVWQAFCGKGEELSLFATGQLVEKLKEVSKFLTTISAGYKIPTYLLPGMSKALINSSPAKVFKITTLKPMKEFAQDESLMGFATDFVTELGMDKTLDRFVISDDIYADLDDAKLLKGFIGLHNASNITLMYISKNEFMRILHDMLISPEQADVLMFTGRLLFGVVTDSDLKVNEQKDAYGNSAYTVYAIEDKHDLEKYVSFFNALQRHCLAPEHRMSGNVICTIKSNSELAEKYGLVTDK